MSEPLYFIAALSFLLLMNSYADAYSSICSVSVCGDVSVDYPFWLVNNNTTQQYCGYPYFGLNCSDGRTIITLPSDSYYVTGINYDARTLTLVDIDVVNQICPRVRHNVSLEDQPLSYNQGDMNLTFYFNCSVSYVTLPNSIECLKCEGSNKESYVFEMGEEPNNYEWNIYCEEKVVVVVKKGEISSGDLVSGFGKAMNNGVVLDWGKARDCVDCEDSGGYCGFNQTTNQRLCFCKDGSIATNQSCNKGTIAFS